MKRTAITSILALATVVFAGLYVSTTLKKPVETPSPVETPLSVETPSPSTLESVADNTSFEETLKEKNERIGVLQLRLKKTEAQISDNKNEIEGLLDELEKAENSNRDMAAAIKNAAAQTNMAQVAEAEELKRIRDSLSERYADLFNNLGLSRDDGDEFLSLLVSLQDPNTNMTESGVSEKIKELFGEGVLNQYADYNKFLPVRDFVDDFDGYLAKQNYSLSKSQKDALLQIDPDLINGQIVNNGEMVFSVNGTNDISTAVDRKVDKTAETYDVVLNQARGTLNQDQLDALDTYLGEQFAQKEAQAKRAERFMKSVLSGPFANSSTNGPTSFHIYN